MSFPLAEWIDSHETCPHNLALSGMRGTIRHPIPTRSDLRTADAGSLRQLLADDLDVDARRLFLTAGATDANGRVISYLARRPERRSLAARVHFPEYPPLFDTARWAGFRLDPTGPPGSVALAVLSNPQNPEGRLWSRSEILDWSAGAEALLVDETFREFAPAVSVHDLERKGVWTTGSFTKFFAGDDLRVGFVVAPEEERESFAEYHGLVVDPLASFSVAGALATFRARDRVRGDVRRVFERNLAAFRREFPGTTPPSAPVWFDRTPADGERCATRALSAGVLVCPGGYFGDPNGVRLCLTRRSFPADVAAYRAVRDRSGSI